MNKRSFLGVVIASILIAVPSLEARSISDIPVAREALLRIVSPKFYQSLLISPVEDWVVVRGDLVKDHLRAARVVRSDGDATYNKLALELANHLQVVDLTRIAQGESSRAVLLHLLVYRIADGTMAMSFAHFAEGSGNQLRYSGAAWMAVQKGDKWIPIEPRQLTPGERRGPRTYTLAVEPANSARSLQGNGRPPVAASMTIEGAPVFAGHGLKLK
jgi:hypothetical protein